LLLPPGIPMRIFVPIRHGDVFAPPLSFGGGEVGGNVCEEFGGGEGRGGGGGRGGALGTRHLGRAGGGGEAEPDK
jgi:hypothetical protein